MMRSRMASAIVGLPTISYQRSIGIWLVIISEPFVVAVLDDLQQIALLLGGQRFRTPVVDDQQTGALQRCQHAWQPALATGSGEFGEQPRRALIQHREAFPAGFVAERAGQPRLPGPGRSHDILPRNSLSTFKSITRTIRRLASASLWCVRFTTPVVSTS